MDADACVRVRRSVCFFVNFRCFIWDQLSRIPQRALFVRVNWVSILSFFLSVVHMPFFKLLVLFPAFQLDVSSYEVPPHTGIGTYN